MMVLALAHIHALGLLTGTLAVAGDPSNWGINILDWVVAKGGLILTLLCTALCIVGAVTFVGGSPRKGLERVGTGLAGILLGVWITSGAAATFIQSFNH